jgi:hypothetical protein
MQVILFDVDDPLHFGKSDSSSDMLSKRGHYGSSLADRAGKGAKKYWEQNQGDKYVQSRRNFRHFGVWQEPHLG